MKALLSASTGPVVPASAPMRVDKPPVRRGGSGLRAVQLAMMIGVPIGTVATLHFAEELPSAPGPMSAGGRAAAAVAVGGLALSMLAPSMAKRLMKPAWAPSAGGAPQLIFDEH